MVIIWKKKTREDKYGNLNNNTDDQVSVCPACDTFSCVFKKSAILLVTMRLECNSNLSSYRFWDGKLNCWFFSVFLFQLDFVANLFQLFLNWQFFNEYTHWLINTSFVVCHFRRCYKPSRKVDDRLTQNWKMFEI